MYPTQIATMWFYRSIRLCLLSLNMCVIGGQNPCIYCESPAPAENAWLARVRHAGAIHSNRTRAIHSAVEKSVVVFVYNLLSELALRCIHRGVAYSPTIVTCTVKEGALLTVFAATRVEEAARYLRSSSPLLWAIILPRVTPDLHVATAIPRGMSTPHCTLRCQRFGSATIGTFKGEYLLLLKVPMTRIHRRRCRIDCPFLSKCDGHVGVRNLPFILNAAIGGGRGGLARQ